MQVSFRLLEKSHPEAEKLLNLIIDFCIPRGFEYYSVSEELVLSNVDLEKALYCIEHLCKVLRSSELSRHITLLEFKIIDL